MNAANIPGPRRCDDQEVKIPLSQLNNGTGMIHRPAERRRKGTEMVYFFARKFLKRNRVHFDHRSADLRFRVTDRPSSDGLWSVGSEVFLDPAHPGLPHAPHLQSLFAEFNSKLWAFSHAFQYSSKEIESGNRRQALEGKAEFEANECNRKIVPSFGYDFLTESQTNAQKYIGNAG
jgi:hypothetical protein